MSLSQQYDLKINKLADQFDKSVAVGQVLHDVTGLRGAALMFDVAEIVEDVIEDVEVYVYHYNKSLEYILGKMPDEIKEAILSR
jgi:hypothetical protein